MQNYKYAKCDSVVVNHAGDSGSNPSLYHIFGLFLIKCLPGQGYGQGQYFWGQGQYQYTQPTMLQYCRHAIFSGQGAGYRHRRQNVTENFESTLVQHGYNYKPTCFVNFQAWCALGHCCLTRRRFRCHISRQCVQKSSNISWSSPRKHQHRQ